MKKKLIKFISTVLVIASFVCMIPKAAPVSALTRDEYVGQFVERMYTMVLGRRSEAAGYEYWKTRILSGETTGATCAYGFFESAEYRSFNTSNEQYVRTLYNVILGRECDPAGLQYWLNFLAGGTARVNILAGFVGSQEYAQICQAYNIAVGTLNADASTTAAVQNAPAATTTSTAATAPTNTGRLSRESDGVYFYNDQGIKLTGWQRYDGYRYYFDPENNGKAVKGWKFIDGLKYYFDDNYRLVQNVSGLIGNQTSYFLSLNLQTNTIIVYAQDTPGGQYNIPVMAMRCSTGAPSSETPQGTFNISKGASWGAQVVNGQTRYNQYISVINGTTMFHTAWYYVQGNHDTMSVSAYNQLGTAATNGDIILNANDARWIWEHCAGNSQIRIYNESSTIPFDQPGINQPVLISGDYGSDPSDIWR